MCYYDELAFDTYYQSGSNRNKIKLHIAQCVDNDIDRETSIKLAYSSCNVACIVLDVIRFRLSINMLNSLVQPRLMAQIENLLLLLKDEQSIPTIPWADASRRHLPVILHSMNGFVVSSTHFDATVHVSIGGQSCWLSVSFQNNGRKWLCTSCDFW